MPFDSHGNEVVSLKASRTSSLKNTNLNNFVLVFCYVGFEKMTKTTLRVKLALLERDSFPGSSCNQAIIHTMYQKYIHAGSPVIYLSISKMSFKCLHN